MRDRLSQSNDSFAFMHVLHSFMFIHRYFSFLLLTFVYFLWTLIFSRLMLLLEKRSTKTREKEEHIYPSRYSEPLIVRAPSIHFHIFSRVTRTLPLKTQVSHADKFLWPSRNILIPLSNRQRELWSSMERVRWIIFHVIILLLLLGRYSSSRNYCDILWRSIKSLFKQFPNLFSLSCDRFDCFTLAFLDWSPFSYN